MNEWRTYLFDEGADESYLTSFLFWVTNGEEDSKPKRRGMQLGNSDELPYRSSSTLLGISFYTRWRWRLTYGVVLNRTTFTAFTLDLRMLLQSLINILFKPIFLECLSINWGVWGVKVNPVGVSGVRTDASWGVWAVRVCPLELKSVSGPLEEALSFITFSFKSCFTFFGPCLVKHVPFFLPFLLVSPISTCIG